MNTSAKKKTTLYFTEGSGLTDADVAAMNGIPGGAFHRNAGLIEPDDKLEACDAVAGPAIPQQYLDAGLPVIEVDLPDTAAKPEDMSVADLKAALTAGNVEFAASAKKAELVALYRDNFEVEGE